MISIHALREEGDATDQARRRPPCDFYPRPPRGGRLQVVGVLFQLGQFLSTPSARRATGGAGLLRLNGIISIHALREEGDPVQVQVQPVRQISIHALREEGDATARFSGPQFAHFYPRPPRGGRRRHPRGQIQQGQFLSTPSARRATRQLAGPNRFLCNFYPRPPRGGRRVNLQAQIDFYAISIHALREEGDAGFHAEADVLEAFLSTPSARRATRWLCSRCGDRSNFYPRPPRGGRRPRSDRCCPAMRFLSTPSARRATCISGRRHALDGISIHALREEGDSSVFVPSLWISNFYPRPPRGGRPGRQRYAADARKISIHALREEGDGPVPQD